ncbi:MAG: Mth938-like domain-containing protein [Bacteroidales bacterium]
MIQEYGFGKMVIDGETYKQDLIITRDGVIPEWWRNKGHQLQLDDLKEVLETHKPDILVVGKGQFGMMSIEQDITDYLHEKNISLEHKKTGKAVQIFNKLFNEGKNVVGAFHLTC